MPENEELVDDNDELIDTPAKGNENTPGEIKSDVESDAIDLAPYIYPAASFFIPLIVYWRTMCQALYIGDGGDFITASYTLGVPHPPGYPLYTLLGKLFLYLPIPGGLSQAAWRMNFMSAFFGALTTLLVYLLIRRITKHNWLAFFASLTIGFGQTFWSQAVIAEVYTLNTFFILLQLNLLIIRTEKKSSNTILWMALALGLSLAHHPSIAIFFPAYLYYSFVHRDFNMSRIMIIALAFGLAIINPLGFVAIILLIPHEFIVQNQKMPQELKTGKSILTFGIVIFLLSLCLYAYLPIVKYKNPVTGPYEFETVKENFDYFMQTVTRSVYQYKATSPGQELTTTPMVFKEYLKRVLWQDYLALIFIFFFGFIALKRKMRIAWVIFLNYALFMMVVLFYPSGDILAAQLKNLQVVLPPLMIPAQIMYMLFGFIGLGCVLDWLPEYVESMREVDPMPPEKKLKFLNGFTAIALIVLVLIVIPIHNWYFCDKSKSLTAYNYARNVVISAPDNSFVLNTGDETFLFWYLRLVENFMPEKKVDLQNWIHNIRDYNVLENEEIAIRDVLMWVLKNREWSLSDPDFSEIDHHLPAYDHYCTTFLTDFIQKDILFASQDVIQHDLLYEFVYKPQEYYDKYNYDIHPDYGVVQIIEPQDEPVEDEEDIPFTTLEKRRMEQSYYDDNYPGVRLIVEGDAPYDDFHWEGLFVPEYDSENKLTSLEYDKSYHDPQEDEIIGRYQEMFHNFGATAMHKASLLANRDEQEEPLRKATAAFRNEIKLKVQDPAGWLSLGNVYIQLRMMDQAVEALTQHRNIMLLNSSTMKEKSKAHYYLAYALFIQGNFNQARDEIDAAILNDSENEKAIKLRKSILEQDEIKQKKIDRLSDGLDSDEKPEDMENDELEPKEIEIDEMHEDMETDEIGE